MAGDTPGPRNAPYDLTRTFDVLVGKDPLPQQRFTVYTDVMTKRSEFFRAARSPQWLADPQKPTDLSDVDPEIFSLYLNIFYFGIRSLWPDDNGGKCDPKNCEQKEADRDNADDRERDREQELADERFKFLVKLYLLADKLQDIETANAVIDQIIEYSDEVSYVPTLGPIKTTYESTTDGSPLRALLRDYWIFEVNTYLKRVLNPHSDSFPSEFYRGFMLRFLDIKYDVAPDSIPDQSSTTVGSAKSALRTNVTTTNMTKSTQDACPSPNQYRSTSEGSNRFIRSAWSTDISLFARP